MQNELEEVKSKIRLHDQAIASLIASLRERQPTSVTEATGNLPQILTHMKLQIADMQNEQKLLIDISERVYVACQEMTKLMFDSIARYSEELTNELKRYFNDSKDN